MTPSAAVPASYGGSAAAVGGGGEGEWDEGQEVALVEAMKQCGKELPDRCGASGDRMKQSGNWDFFCKSLDSSVGGAVAYAWHWLQSWRRAFRQRAAIVQ